MSVEAMAVVLHHSRAKGTAKLVLLGIANHAGDGGAWPSVATLARYANVAPRNVQEALRVLERSGELVTAPQQGGLPATAAHLRPNRYEVALRCPADCDGSIHHRTRQRALYPVTNPSPGDAGITPPPDASITPPGDGGITRTSPKNHPMKSALDSAQLQSVPMPVEDVHNCSRGWVGESDDGAPIPCPVCKPVLAKRVRA